MSGVVKDPELRQHSFDGIQEFDNQLPRWWIGMFYVTIVFAIGYFTYYELLDGPTQDQSLKQALQSHHLLQASQMTAGSGELSAKSLNAILADPVHVASGKAIFAIRCVACHGEHGEGIIGPNLTDEFWLNGDGKIESIAKIISEGVGAKGMPPWRPILSTREIQEVAAFVKSLKGSHPPNPKAPQGKAFQN